LGNKKQEADFAEQLASSCIHSPLTNIGRFALMKLRQLFAGAAGVLGAVALLGSGAEAQDKIRWKMQSAFGSQLPHLGPSGHDVGWQIRDALL
jgi:hypothetical protein